MIRARPVRAAIIVVWAALAAWPSTLPAVEPGEALADPALEARARALSRTIRCLVCQNQSIDDSDAELAADLRRIVRERLTAGDSDAEIRDFMVARYGDFVLLEPPLKPATWLLWYGPAGLLAIGVAIVILSWRRRRERLPPAPLNADETARLADLMREDGEPRQ